MNGILTLSGIGVAALILSVNAAMTPPGEATGGGQLSKATFAGGCFWCMEEAFEVVEGVISVESGYTGGHKSNPTYTEVSAGGTGHTESIEVLFDPSRVSYQQLLDVFWRNVDPTVQDRQFCDSGSQYRTAIFYHNDEQKRLAEGSKERLEKSVSFRGPIFTQIVPVSPFYVAEDYHQDFYKKNPIRYKFYKWNCGRPQRLQELWGTS